MKTTILRKLMLTAVLLTSSHAIAHDFEVDGIYYNIISSDNKTVSVTYKGADYNSYIGNITIPDTVTYNETTYNIISIGESAFRECSGLKTLVIPESVQSIENYAFYNSSNLAQIKIKGHTPSAPTIGSNVFYNNSIKFIVYGGVIWTDAVYGWNEINDKYGSFVKVVYEMTIDSKK